MTAAKVKIGEAVLADIPALMEFVREHWGSGHVLATSRALFEWQHADLSHDRCNFVVARDEQGAIVGMLGYIPLSRYDGSLKEGDRQTVWLTTWKMRADLARGAGLGLLLHVHKLFPSARVGTVGLNPATRGIYDALGYRTGALTRHALLKPGLPEPALMQWAVAHAVPALPGGRARVEPLSADRFMAATEGLGLDDGPAVPVKSRAYIVARYLQHPFYDYRAWLVSDDDAHAVLVTRTCAHAGACAVRVVDFIGWPQALLRAGNAFSTMLGDAEYLDFFAAGLDEELRSAGLVDAATVEGLVLPGHFEPFERRNVALLYSLRHAAGQRIVVCKGDADQDRPNRIGVPS